MEIIKLGQKFYAVRLFDREVSHPRKYEFKNPNFMGTKKALFLISKNNESELVFTIRARRAYKKKLNEK